MTKTHNMLPCPFCGGNPTLKPSTRGDYTSIVCPGACGPLVIVIPNDRIEEGVAAWNRRAAAPQAVPAGFVTAAAFDRLHAHAEQLAARLLADDPAAPAASEAASTTTATPPPSDTLWRFLTGGYDLQYVNKLDNADREKSTLIERAAINWRQICREIGAEAAPQAAPAAPSPTVGMNIAQRILHVGGRNNAAGYVEFGGIQAVEALVRQVLRDTPSTKGEQALLSEEELRARFEALARDSYNFKRSRRDCYVNPAVARDWKWFRLGAAKAAQGGA